MRRAAPCAVAAAAAAAALLAVACRGPSAGGKVTLFAAAGTTNAVTEVVEAFPGGEVELSLAASSTLARQIEKGAPADLYISASHEWMDYLEERGMLAPGTRRDLAGNRLALVAPRDSDIDVEVGEGMDLVSLLGGGRLSTGDPEHVPVGMYAKEALEHLGMWEGVKDRLAPAPTTRAALAMVERGECALGIVYATDARGSSRVRLLGLFPEETHTPIVFSVAIVAGHDGPLARKLMDHLTGEASAKVFAAHGYEVL